MSLLYGIKSLHQGAGADIPHIFGYNTTRTVADDPVFEIWKGATDASQIFRMSMEGQLGGQNGLVSKPTYGFEGDKNSGMYLIGADNLGLAVGGVKILDIASTGLTLTGTLTITSHFAVGDDDEIRFGASTDYWLVYDSANTRFKLTSTDIDGIGTDGDVFRVEDGTDDVNFVGTITLGSALAVTSGGTGLATFAQGDIVHASALNTLAGLTKGAEGTILRAGASVAAYTTATFPATTTRGAVLIASAANVWTAYAVGSAGKVLRSDGTDLLYTTATFADTYAAGDLLYASALNTAGGLTVGGANAVLTSNGTVPGWTAGLTNDHIAAAAGIVASKIAAGTFAAGTYSFAGSTFSDLGIVTTVDINGGTLDGVTIGGAATAAGSFTTVTTSGIVSVDDTTDTTSGVTGSIHTDGGIGVAKNLYVATNATVVGTSTLTGSILAGAAAHYVGDTSNANMTTGWTINQLGADNEILAFKSSDTAHGVTGITETDNYAFFQKSQAADGGLMIEGLIGGTASRGLGLRGTQAGGASTSKATTSVGVIEIAAFIKSGTGRTDVGADGNLVTIANNATTRFIFDAEGSAHADIEWVAFDRFNDLAVIEDMETHLAGDLVQRRFGEVVSHDRAFFERERLLHDIRQENGRTRGMLNTTRVLMLSMGAIRQVGSRTRALEDALRAVLLDNPSLVGRDHALAALEN